MTKIILDTQIFVSQEFGGISRYFVELFTQLAKNNELEISCPLLYTDNIYFRESSYYAESYQQKNAFLIRFSKIFRPFAPRKLKRKSLQSTMDLLNSQDFNLFIPTYYDPSFLEYIQQKPFVLTVHDMIHELYPWYFPEDHSTVANKKILIERATKIIAISENTKLDILRMYPETDPGKIEVIYLAHTVSPAAGFDDPDLPENYILYVGNRAAYKNFKFFIQAVAPVLEQNDDLHIFCAGGNPFSEEEQSWIMQLGIERRIVQKNFKDEDLEGYYKKALFFVFPSEYEGFGIPVLESMAAGCPIILTRNSSFPEVAGDAGLFFELNDEEDLRSKILYLLNNNDIRAEFVRKGIEQSAKFSWEKTAARTLEIYQQAVSDSIE